MKLLALRRWSDPRRRRTGPHPRPLERARLRPGPLASIGRSTTTSPRAGTTRSRMRPRKFDGADIPPERLLVSPGGDGRGARVDRPEVLDGIRVAIENVRAFTEAQLAADAPTAGGRRSARAWWSARGSRRSRRRASSSPAGRRRSRRSSSRSARPAVVAGVPRHRRRRAAASPARPRGRRHARGGQGAGADDGSYRGNGPAGDRRDRAGDGVDPPRAQDRGARAARPSRSPRSRPAVRRGHEHDLRPVGEPPDRGRVGRPDARRARPPERGGARADSAALLLTDSLALAEAVDAEAARMVEAAAGAAALLRERVGDLGRRLRLRLDGRRGRLRRATTRSSTSSSRPPTWRRRSRACATPARPCWGRTRRSAWRTSSWASRRRSRPAGSPR